MTAGDPGGSAPEKLYHPLVQSHSEAQGLVFSKPSKSIMIRRRAPLLYRPKAVASGFQSLRTTSQLHFPHPNLTYSPKMHYCIVFEEEGVTIDDLRQLCDVMKVLGDIAAGMFFLTIHSYGTQLSCDIALQLLKKLKWMHWDVSIGNIFLYKGGGKLADLEYAKQTGNTTSHMRTASGIRFVIWQHAKCS